MMRRASSGSTGSGGAASATIVLRDAGEALDPARQRPRHAHQRLEALVQLAAADQHGADLGQLAVLAGSAVGLHVDGEELGGGEGQVGDCHTEPVRPAPDGMQGRVRASARPSRGRSTMASTHDGSEELDEHLRPQA